MTSETDYVGFSHNLLVTQRGRIGHRRARARRLATMSIPRADPPDLDQLQPPSFMHLQLIVPDLFWVHEAPLAAHAGLAVTSIETLVARGRKRITPAGSLEAWLLASFGVSVETALPVAPFALADHGTPHEGRYWLCVDPVHLRIGRDDFTMQDATTLAIDPTEAASMIESLNRHFRDRGYRFIAPSPSHWYLSTPAPFAATTVSRHKASGQAVDALRPTGTGALGLQTLINEVQMLLHEHPVNMRREQLDRPIINSVWPWGGGTSEPVTPPKLTELYADDPLARGLGHTIDIAVNAVPDGLTNLTSDGRARGVVWVVLDRLRSASAYRDVQAWRAGLSDLETRWFTPALDALRQRQLGMLTLYAIGPSSTLAIESTATDLRYFWRRRKNLSAYINAATPIAGVQP